MFNRRLLTALIGPVDATSWVTCLVEGEYTLRS